MSLSTSSMRAGSEVDCRGVPFGLEEFSKAHTAVRQRKTSQTREAARLALSKCYPWILNTVPSELTIFTSAEAQLYFSSSFSSFSSIIASSLRFDIAVGFTERVRVVAESRMELSRT